MKTLFIFFSLFCITTTGMAQQIPAENVARVAFTLRNNLGYHVGLRAEGPGMAYGFTMNRNESTPKNWPVGSKLYFSRNGETNGEFILTVTAADAGKTLLTYPPPAPTQPALDEVTVRFRNNSLKPHRVALITYKPNETGNGTQIFPMAPYGTTKQRLPVGTKVYFADSKQVDVVMSGKRIDTEKPLLVVKKEDAGSTVNIFD